MLSCSIKVELKSNSVLIVDAVLLLSGRVTGMTGVCQESSNQNAASKKAHSFCLVQLNEV